MLSFGSAPGNLFNRLGKLGLIIKQAKSYQTSQQPNLIDTTNGAVAQYDGESDLQALIGSAYIGILNNVSTAGSLAKSVAVQTINRMVFRDNPQIGQTLTSLNTTASINEVIRQMKLQGATVLAMTIGATPSSFTGTGNGVINASVRRPFDGLVLENSFAETVKFTCTDDSYGGNATAGNEPFTLTGTGAQNDFFAFNWPLGSNATTTLSAIDGNSNNTNGNLLTNSGFNAFTANIPDNWSLITGTAGTTIASENSLIYDGAAALRIIGDGATLTNITQRFDVSTGTLGTLTPQTQYSINLFMRRDGVAPANGTLTIDLIDGTNTVINDANAVANTFNIDLTALTTTYASYTGVFRTPAILPAAQYLRLRLTGTALTTGRTVYLDKLSMGKMTQLGTSFPFFTVHSGSTPFLASDYGTVAITNSRGSGGTLSTFQTLWAQLFTSDMIGNEFLLPSSATPTISDSALIA